MAGNVEDITDSNFEEKVLKAELPVFVDFWAPWCGPCKSVAPIIDELADEYKGRMLFYKLNVDDNPKTPSQYGIRGIPNLIIFKNGEVVDQLIGALPKSEIVESIEKALG